ncbi:hypothetical protein HY478_03775 [Candidatus Uhrbacteria bacterium]|nr:hypothetical protein [Candidatus Uhrbacteria bacterium]
MTPPPRNMLILLGLLLAGVALVAWLSVRQIYDAIAPQAHAPTGETCGGVANSSCSPGYMCEYPNTAVVDSVGVCVSVQ